MADGAQQSPQRMTVAEFLVWDDGTDVRSELVRGEIVAMTAPGTAHGAILHAVSVALAPAIRPPCRILIGVGLLLPGSDEDLLVPDLLVDCGPRDRGGRFAAQPTFVLEILSPSTKRFDLGEKRIDYQSIASLTQLLFIDSERPWAQLLTRQDPATWLQRDYLGDAQIPLDAFSATLDMAPVWRAAGLEMTG